MGCGCLGAGGLGFLLWVDEVRAYRVAAYCVCSEFFREQREAFPVVTLLQHRIYGRPDINRTPVCAES